MTTGLWVWAFQFFRMYRSEGERLKSSLRVCTSRQHKHKYSSFQTDQSLPAMTTGLWVWAFQFFRIYRSEGERLKSSLRILKANNSSFEASKQHTSKSGSFRWLEPILSVSILASFFSLGFSNTIESVDLERCTFDPNGTVKADTDPTDSRPTTATDNFMMIRRREVFQSHNRYNGERKMLTSIRSKKNEECDCEIATSARK
jgi:hypothetical protein